MADTFVVFDKAKLAVLTGGLNFSDTFRCALMSAGWTPSMDTSTVASLTSFWHTKGSAGQADRKVGLSTVTYTAAGVIKFDLSDVVFTASTGTNISAMYGVVYGSAQTIPMGYWVLSVSEIVSNQITIQWPAAGLFETSDNV